MVGRREFDRTIETAVYGLPAVMAAKNDMTETDCVAEDAVNVEPVSGPNSLLTGKLTGNSWVFSPFSQ
jgi:hypothetical protein